MEQHKGNCARPGEWEFILALRGLHPSVSESIRTHVNQLSCILNPAKTKLPPPIQSEQRPALPTASSDSSTPPDLEPTDQAHSDPDYKDSPLI